jgi:hypothetical protein
LAKFNYKSVFVFLRQAFKMWKVYENIYQKAKKLLTLTASDDKTGRFFILIKVSRGEEYDAYTEVYEGETLYCLFDCISHLILRFISYG